MNVLAQTLKNICKFHFVSKSCSQYVPMNFNLFVDTTLPAFQCRINVVLTSRMLKQRWSDVENETKSEVEFSTSVSSCKTTFNQRCTTSMQPFFNFAQCRFNVDVTLSQRCFNVASTSGKAISKPIWLVKSMDLQKDLKVLFC